MAKPYLTSQDIINSVKRKIMFPIAQQTFNDSDVLAFANEEMMISQVPSVLEYHEEYFVFVKNIPLVNQISRYPIPSRAIGMRLRDLAWADQQGNLFEMTRINADDKSFFQRNIGSNQAIGKFYLEGNDMVLTPAVVSEPTGSLYCTFFLRPNQLVANSRAATIENYVKSIVVDSSQLTIGDKLQITLAQNTPNTIVDTFTATQRAITSVSIGNPTTITTVDALDYDIGETFGVYISEVSGNTPSVQGLYTATVTGLNTFTVPVTVTVGGTGGYYAFEDEFTIGSTDIQTAANLALAIGTVITDVTANNSSTSTCTLTYDDITLETESFLTNSDAITVDEDHVFINFDQLPSTWTDPQTNMTEDLFTVGGLVDFLQINPGHKTFNYDVETVNISGTIGEFNKSDFQYYASIGTGSVLKWLQIDVGNYICIANECIIPQIPPDLHNGLAERTAGRILAAIGDQQGLDRINTKIDQIDKAQGTLLDQRVDGSSEKVFARHSLLRYGKFYSRRRV